MQKIRSYLQLCLDIELAKYELRSLRKQKREIEAEIKKYGGPALYRSPQYHELKIDLKYMTPSHLEHYWNKLEEVEREIQLKEKELKGLEYCKKSIDKIIESMNSLKSKVAIMREIQNKTVVEIADELGYSEGYIKNLSSKIRRELYD